MHCSSISSFLNGIHYQWVRHRPWGKGLSFVMTSGIQVANRTLKPMDSLWYWSKVKQRWGFSTPLMVQNFFPPGIGIVFCNWWISPGVGAFAAPLAATQFSRLPRWSFHYLVSLGIAVVNVVLLIVVFGSKQQDGKCCPPNCLFDYPMHIARVSRVSWRGHSWKDDWNWRPDLKFPKGLEDQSRPSLVSLYPNLRWCWGYHRRFVDCQIKPGRLLIDSTGWIVTFIIDARHGGPSSGYISSGFYGGTP